MPFLLLVYWVILGKKFDLLYPWSSFEKWVQTPCFAHVPELFQDSKLCWIEKDCEAMSIFSRKKCHDLLPMPATGIG